MKQSITRMLELYCKVQVQSFVTILQFINLTGMLFLVEYVYICQAKSTAFRHRLVAANGDIRDEEIGHVLS